jgi:hypothetical protein
MRRHARTLAKVFTSKVSRCLGRNRPMLVFRFYTKRQRTMLTRLQSAPSTSTPTGDASILSRLAILENAVFGSGRQQPHTALYKAPDDTPKGAQTRKAATIPAASVSSSSLPRQYDERAQEAKVLDSKCARNHHEAGLLLHSVKSLLTLKQSCHPSNR